KGKNDGKRQRQRVGVKLLLFNNYHFFWVHYCHLLHCAL
ncbi:uncharacterized protein METZ01_LOCUS146370, partial [marine metagenome]